MIPNKQVLDLIQRYDPKLYVKWNNMDHVWEVWRKMPWGSRLVTPVSQNIYTEGAGYTFAPLDHRIIDWLYYSDSQRKDLHVSWKFRKKRTVHLREQVKWKKYNTKLKEIANENYYLVNSDLNKLQVLSTGDSEWKRPEYQSFSNKRVMYRKEYYDGNSDN